MRHGDKGVSDKDVLRRPVIIAMQAAGQGNAAAAWSDCQARARGYRAGARRFEVPFRLDRTRDHAAVRKILLTKCDRGSPKVKVSEFGFDPIPRKLLERCLGGQLA